MHKLIYGIICVMISVYCLYITGMCRKKQEDIAGVTAKVCLSGALFSLLNAFTLFFEIQMLYLVALCGMFLCADIFLYFILEYTVKLTDVIPWKKSYKLSLGLFTLLDGLFLMSNPWTNFVFDYKSLVQGPDIVLSMVPYTWYFVHCAYIGLGILAVIVLLVIKCYQVPIVYAGRYLLELVWMVIIAAINVLYVITLTPMDLSGLLYGAAACGICQCLFQTKPSILRKHARALLLNKLPEPILLFDNENLLMDYNTEAAEKFNLSKKDIAKMTRECFEINILQMSYEAQPDYSINREAVLHNEYSVVNYLVTMHPLLSLRNLDMGNVYILQDVSKQKMMSNAMENMSAYDELTGFYTHRIFNNKLEEWNKEQKEYIVAICNITGMKLLNAFYEREVGSSVIRQMAEELRNVLPEDSLLCYTEDDCAIIVARDITENQMNLYLFNAARKLNDRTMENVPVFLDYGIARRENVMVSVEEYIKYARMDMLIKKGRSTVGRKQEMSRALTEEYFNKEYESLEHVNRIKVLAKEMADKLKLSVAEREKLELLCTYHDIGRVKTREEVWNRAALISRNELDVVKLHSITGYQIASELELKHDIASYVLYHHENYDGSGYPYGLSGEEIPLLSRILAIVDSYDVMINNRPYKGVVSEETALAELHKNAGTQFDPALVIVFEQCLKERK